MTTSILSAEQGGQAVAAQQVRTSVVVVAYNSGKDLWTCIERLVGLDDSVEVIVSDNASSDGSVLALGQMGSARLRILQNGANLGFGAACNRGAALAVADHLLFLNPDCEIGRDTIRELRRVMDSHEEIGLLGTLQVDTAGRVDPNSRRRDPLLRRTLLSALGVSRWQQRWPALGGIHLTPAPTNLAQPIEFLDAVSGALMYVRKSAFEYVNGFDEGYFLHFEDLDLCRRLRIAGFAVACATQLRTEHRKGGSSKSRPLFVAWHKHRGMWRWFVQHDPASKSAALRLLVRTVLVFHFLFFLLIRALKMRFTIYKNS